jgi:hypothetical protein
VGEPIVAAHGEAFDLLLGCRTYDIFTGYWPKAEKSPMADSLNAATKYVATHRPDSLVWAGRGPWAGHSRGRSPHQEGKRPAEGLYQSMAEAS